MASGPWRSFTPPSRCAAASPSASRWPKRTKKKPARRRSSIRTSRPTLKKFSATASRGIPQRGNSPRLQRHYRCRTERPYRSGNSRTSEGSSGRDRNRLVGRDHRRVGAWTTSRQDPSPKADLPVNFVREKLGDELSIVRKDFLCVRALAAFRVEIVGIELPHPLEQGLVALIHQVPVSAMPVRRVERMVPEHVLRLFRQVFLRYAVNVFVVSKREVNVIQPAVRLVDPILRLIFGLVAVWIGGKEFRENHLIRVRAPGGERIADYGPL